MEIFNIPFSKWYIKEYHNKYDIEKMFKVYNSDNNENKNFYLFFFNL